MKNHAYFKSTPDMALCGSPRFDDGTGRNDFELPSRFYPPLTTALVRTANQSVTCFACAEILRKEVRDRTE